MQAAGGILNIDEWSGCEFKNRITTYCLMNGAGAIDSNDMGYWQDRMTQQSSIYLFLYLATTVELCLKAIEVAFIVKSMSASQR